MFGIGINTFSCVVDVDDFTQGHVGCHVTDPRLKEVYLWSHQGKMKEIVTPRGQASFHLFP